MRIFMPIVAAICTAAVLFHEGPQQAFACTCGPIPHDQRSAEEYFEDYFAFTPEDWGRALVLASVEDLPGSEPSALTADMLIERTYRGSAPARVTVASLDCNGLTVDFRQGQRWLMDIVFVEGRWRAHGCSSGLVDGYVETNPYNDGDPWLAALNKITPPAEGDASAAPAATRAQDDRGGASGVAIGVTIAGLAALAAASMFAATRSART
jgi:hypothetical protein